MTRGERSPATPALWESLAPRNVLAGTRDHPEMTTVGEQVLHELQVRAYRTDPRPIDAVAAEIGATVATLAGIADNAEYFVAELGPVPPVDVLPYLRVVAVSLACRPESPEDLVEEFKNAWGSMEVLGGTDADRLLAAELISASGVGQESFYAPLTQTVDRLRSAGCRTPLATAALLQLHPQMTSVLRVDPWVVARRKVGADEEAAMLATAFDLPEALRRWEAWKSALEGSETDRRRSAAYLTLEGEPTPTRISRIRETATLLKGMFDSPTLAAALATSHLAFAPTEVHDWLMKGVQVAASRQLAPTRAELAVLGLAMLRGLRLEGAASEVTGGGSEVRVRSEIGLPAHVALHAWLYRETRRPTPG
jgi:hypothetical protein